MEISSVFKQKEMFFFHTPYSAVIKFTARSYSAGPKRRCFSIVVCIRLNLRETTNCKDKMQSLAEKAPNLRIAGGACKREFVSYVLALSIS